MCGIALACQQKLRINQVVRLREAASEDSFRLQPGTEAGVPDRIDTGASLSCAVQERAAS